MSLQNRDLDNLFLHIFFHPQQYPGNFCPLLRLLLYSELCSQFYLNRIHLIIGIHAVTTKSGKQSNPLKQFQQQIWNIIPITVTLALTFVAVSILLILFGVNPIAAFQAMWDGAFGSQNTTAETLVKATPILFVAIGITIAFRGGVINIGGEGQMIAGALATIAITLAIGERIGGFVIPIALFAGFFAGGVYGAIAGVLKAYFDVNEILSTIMMNQIMVQLMNFLLNGVLLDPESGVFNHIPKTARVADIARLPRLAFNFAAFDLFGLQIGPFHLFDRTRLHWGFIIAVVLAIIVYVLLWRTTIGYRIRAVGLNMRASRYAGISVERQMVLSMFLAGGFAGLAGAVQVLGLNYLLQTDGSPAGFTGNAGFNGIVAALFGYLNPIGAVFSSVFFGGLLIGAQQMQRELGVPASMITAINGLIVIFVVSSQIFVTIARQRQRIEDISDAEPDVETAEEGVTS